MTQQPYQKQSSTPVLLYVPNLLGYIRILFAFIGLYYSILHQPIIAILMWIFASVLDLFDGMLARLLHQTSQFGILLDIIADNILRTIIYIATCNAASIAYYISTAATAKEETQPNHIGQRIVSSHSATIAIILVSCFIICMEWITMISTQLYTLYHATVDTEASKKSTESPHWKKIVSQTSTTTATTNRRRPSKKADEEWWIVQYYFSNNFCNPIGMLGIYGLFASNLFLYGCHYPIVYQHIPYYNMWMYLAFLGRLLSLVIELKFCYRFIHYIISRDDKKES
jgi:CDP-alcohol phosphatidyltransferase